MENNIGIGADEQHLYIRRAKAWKFLAAGIQPHPDFGGFCAMSGQTLSPRTIHTGGFIPSSSYELLATVDKVYLSEVFVQANMLVTGVNLLFGASVAGGVSVGLYDSTGKRLAVSGDVTGSDVTSANHYGPIPFTAPLVINGPGTYFIGAVNTDNGSALTFETHESGAFSAWDADTDVAASTVPPAKLSSVPTSFTANKGPVASLY